MSGTVALAFSGGLDTSFCVPYLREQGYDVVTIFVDTGGQTGDDAAAIERRALEVGAVRHLTVDASDELWDTFVVPFVMGGAPYQDQYPLLCSDRYVIASRLARVAGEIGAVAVAHGCTAMGNDQVRFDQALRCLTPLPILAPIREIQAVTESPRAYEMDYLRERGFAVSATSSRYTINENALGVTISGSEIDDFAAPSDATRRLTVPPSQWPRTPVRAALTFESGRAVALDGVPVAGPAILGTLNERFGACGVGRGIYTGDTVIGLKGRIVFEAPGLTALLTAHRALEQTTLTRAQNAFKPLAARRWTELVYTGFFFEPLRSDLETLIRSMQTPVSGTVTIESEGGTCLAVAVESDAMLVREGTMYAQRADWSAADAEGFIKLLGLSSAMAADRDRRLTEVLACPSA